MKGHSNEPLNEPFAGSARKQQRSSGGSDMKPRCAKCDRSNHSTENCKAHLRCSTCNYRGHTADTCRAHLRCTFCNFKGHTVDECRQKKRMQSGEGSSQVNHISALYDNHGHTTESFPFSQAECAQLRELLKENQPQAGKITNHEELSGKAASLANTCCHTPTWLIDSGASDHIVCDAKFLTSKQLVMHYTVRLPSGSSAQVTHIGTVIFSSQLKLENILCVPSFYLNLISVSKLARDSFYVTIFLRQLCIMQDLRSGKMIGMGHEREGVYCLDIYQKGTCSVAHVQKSNLWHWGILHKEYHRCFLFLIPQIVVHQIIV